MLLPLFVVHPIRCAHSWQPCDVLIERRIHDRLKGFVSPKITHFEPPIVSRWQGIILCDSAEISFSVLPQFAEIGLLSEARLLSFLARGGIAVVSSEQT